MPGESYFSSNAKVGSRENTINHRKNGAFVAVSESRHIMFARFMKGVLYFSNVFSVCSTHQKY